LLPWLEGDATRDLVAGWSEACGVDLVRHGSDSPAEAIADTALTQPLLLAAALLSYRAALAVGAVPGAPALGAVAVAGHSVGEFAAAVIAGVLTEADAFRAVGVRGRAMGRCAAAAPTGLAAVVGGDPAEVLDAIGQVGASPANYNGPGQIVAGGPLAALEALAERPPARARVIRLEVAGAFHTEYMAEAQVEVEAALASVAVRDAVVPLISNLDGRAVASGDDIVQRLVKQVTAPVRWDLVLETCAALAAEGDTGLEQLELAPAGVLTGLAKRGLKALAAQPGGLTLTGLKTPADLAVSTPN
jgi:[acyl-carrier-protein] S-malonyltransferase